MTEAPWCTVIIPTLNEARALPATLAALAACWPEDPPEVVIVDGGSTDGTGEIARANGAKVIPSAPGRARQLNAGARSATGQWFYFLHADTLPPADLPRHLRAAAQNGTPACFSISFDRQAESWWLRTFGRLSAWDVDAFRFGDQSLFVSKAQFFTAGGYREDHQLLEGHELVRRLRRTTGSFSVLDAAVTTSARRYLAHGVVFTQLVFAVIFCFYRVGVGQEVLGRVYRRAFGA